MYNLENQLNNDICAAIGQLIKNLEKEREI